MPRRSAARKARSTKPMIMTLCRTYVLQDGEVIAGDGFTLECVATPGHTANHVCYALREEQALFSGDHVMGWSTSVIAPPDGDMGAYMASLEKLMARDDAFSIPPMARRSPRPRDYLRELLAHRRAREAQILAALQQARPRPATGAHGFIPTSRPACVPPRPASHGASRLAGKAGPRDARRRYPAFSLEVAQKAFSRAILKP